jgi:hypothetical protein
MLSTPEYTLGSFHIEMSNVSAKYNSEPVLGTYPTTHFSARELSSTNKGTLEYRQMKDRMKREGAKGTSWKIDDLCPQKAVAVYKK